MVTPRDILILRHLSRYFMLNRKQVERLVFEGDSRQARRRLNALVQENLIRRRNLQAINPEDGSSAPVYHLTANGRAFLAMHFDDPSIRLLPVDPKQPMYVFHYLAVAETAMLFHAAVEREEEIAMPIWINEDHVVNVDELDKRKHFALESVAMVRGRKVICDPDAAFLLEYKDTSAVFYLEQDRDRNQWQGRIASKKNPGYEQMYKERRHRKHFPQTTLPYFFVLFITPSAKRRDQLGSAFAHQNKDKDHGKVIRFAALPDLQSAVTSGQSLFFDPLFYRADNDAPVTLVNR